MSTPREWAYYRLDRILTDDPPIFFRSWRGFVDRLDRQAMTWVSLDSDPVSRYLKNGEVGFDETTRAEIETTLVGEQALSPLVQVRFPPTIRLGLDGSILFTR